MTRALNVTITDSNKAVPVYIVGGGGGGAGFTYITCVENLDYDTHVYTLTNADQLLDAFDAIIGAEDPLAEMIKYRFITGSAEDGMTVRDAFVYVDDEHGNFCYVAGGGLTEAVPDVAALKMPGQDAEYRYSNDTVFTREDIDENGTLTLQIIM